MSGNRRVSAVRKEGTAEYAEIAEEFKEKTRAKLCVSCGLCGQTRIIFVRQCFRRRLTADNPSDHSPLHVRLRCISCGATPESAGRDFRCTRCGDLLEFFFPGWSFDPDGPEISLAQSQDLPQRARPERCVALPRTPAADSGRARHHSARRQHSALSTAPLRASHRARPSPRQASGHEPDGILQRHGHDLRRVVSPSGRVSLGGLRFHRQHVGFDGGLRCARKHAQPGADPRRQDLLGQALAIARLRSPHLPASHRFRRLRAHPERTRPPEAGLSV